MSFIKKFQELHRKIFKYYVFIMYVIIIVKESQIQ